MRVRGPSLLQLVRRSDAFADLVTEQIRQIMLGLAADVDESFTTDDLGVISSYWLDVASEKLAQVVQETYDESASDVMRQVVQTLTERNPDVDVDAFRVADPVAEQYLQEAVNRLRGIGNEVWEHARSQLLDGFQLGESIDQLRDRLVKTTELAAPRAEVIARTEVIGASNAGAFEQMRATGLTSTKEWLATRGPRTRPSHARVNGTVLPLDEKFTVGGWPCDRPHDPSLPPGESINCRCTLIFDVLDEEPQPTTLVEEPVTPEVPKTDKRPTLDALLGARDKRSQKTLANNIFKFKSKHEKKSRQLRAQVDEVLKMGEGKIRVKGYVYDHERLDVGEFTRYLERDDDDGTWFANHDFLALNTGYRGQGFAKQWNDSMFDWYRANDVKYVKLLANIDVGGYAWAKQGFDWLDPIGPKGVAIDVRRSVKLYESNYTAAQLASANAVFDRLETVPFGSPNFPTPYEVAMAGWTEGVDDWPGKRGMLGTRWEGIKWL